MKPMSSNMLRMHCRHTTQAVLKFHSFPLFALPHPRFLTMGVVSSGRDRGVYVNSAKHGWISFTGSIPVTSSLDTSSSETCDRHGLSHWRKRRSSGSVETACYLHVVHHHFIGQVGPELSFMDSLVKQRLWREKCWISGFDRLFYLTFNFHSASPHRAQDVY